MSKLDYASLRAAIGRGATIRWATIVAVYRVSSSSQRVYVREWAYTYGHRITGGSSNRDERLKKLLALGQ